MNLESVQQVGLTWVEVLAAVLFSSPLVVLYSGILRGLSFVEQSLELPFGQKMTILKSR